MASVALSMQAKGFVFFIVNMVLILLTVTLSFIPVGRYGWWSGYGGHIGGVSGIGILALIVDVIWIVFLIIGNHRWSALQFAGGTAATGNGDVVVVSTVCIVPRWPLVLILTILYFLAAILAAVSVAQWALWAYLNPVVWIICTIVAWIAAFVRAFELYWVFKKRASYDGEALGSVDVRVVDVVV